jgi:ABC-type transport system involved in cytochrome bd biosynthesis fused ATPase/permease subunit
VWQAAVLRMTGVGFTYPGTDRQVLRDVNVRCNLNSRVAVLGVRRLETSGPETLPL